MHSLSGGAGGASVNGAAARDKAWTEYVDTLRDSLTESKVIDMVVGTPRILGYMGVGTPNPHIQRIQVVSLTDFVTASKSQREPARIGDVCYMCRHT